MLEVYVLCAVCAVFVIGYLYIRYQQKMIAKQARQIEQNKAEMTAVKEEIRNVEQRKEIDAANRRLTANGIDDQLQSKGYFRAD